VLPLRDVVVRRSGQMLKLLGENKLVEQRISGEFFD
jgi:hypothetical protein